MNWMLAGQYLFYFILLYDFLGGYHPGPFISALIAFISTKSSTICEAIIYIYIPIFSLSRLCPKRRHHRNCHPTEGWPKEWVGLERLATRLCILLVTVIGPTDGRWLNFDGFHFSTEKAKQTIQIKA